MIPKAVLDSLEYYKVLEAVARYTHTENGKQIITNHLPFSNNTDAVKQGDYVSEAKEILIKNENPPFDAIPDLNEALEKSKIEGGILTSKQILSILTLAQTSRKLLQYLRNHGEDTVIYNNYFQNLFYDKMFEHHISSVFDDAGEIKDNATPKLKEIRNDINDKSAQLRKVVNKLLKSLSESYLVQEEYITQRDGRIVVPVKAEHKRHVRGFIHSESATGQTVYIEPEETLELNNDILSLNFAERREKERILKNLTKKIGGLSKELKTALRTISELDAVFAKAKYSFEIIGSFPSFDESKPLNILIGRHPLLIKKLGRENTVPLNFEIKNDNIFLITGPNAGGKTVVLKTIGLIMLMAQSGIHIPAEADSNLHFFNNILLDIGDKQSIEDDLSTFSSHLSNIKNILDKADSKSLVLLDEIGTGTDPAEGSALAAAVLIILRDSKAKVMATTHHGSLKLVANDLDGFQNASMEFDTKNLKPTYVFQQGLPGSSYAFEVAERIGLDKKFIKLAKEYIDKDKNKIEQFLVDLETKSRDIKRKLNNAEIENTRLKGLTNLYEEKISELENQKKKILKDAKEKAELFLNDVNKKVENAIKHIRETNASKEVIKEEKEKIAELKYETKELIPEIEIEKSKDNGNFKIGDYVAIKDTATTGTIDQIDKKKGNVTVASGSIKLQVKLNKLLHAKRKKEVSDEYSHFNFTAKPLSSNRLDIRGRKPEEVELEIIKFIDDAYASNINTVEILHGKGTGVLKKLTHEILKSHDNIKTYYFAKIEMGGEGITIAELKS